MGKTRIMGPTTNPMGEQPKTALRDNLLGLFKHCPVELSNPEDCPLFAVRKAGPTRRLRWFNDLTEDDLVYLNAYHNVCERIKIESRGGQNPQLSISLPPPSDSDAPGRD
jgi:hypothetical protein